MQTRSSLWMHFMARKMDERAWESDMFERRLYVQLALFAVTENDTRELNFTRVNSIYSWCIVYLWFRMIPQTWMNITFSINKSDRECKCPVDCRYPELFMRLADNKSEYNWICWSFCRSIFEGVCVVGCNSGNRHIHECWLERGLITSPGRSHRENEKTVRKLWNLRNWVKKFRRLRKLKIFSYKFSQFSQFFHGFHIFSRGPAMHFFFGIGTWHHSLIYKRHENNVIRW